MVFVIHANLDAEARWAGRALPGGIAARASYYAALLAALAPDDATEVEVWAPAAIDASRLVPDPAWRVPTMRVGTPPRADLVWASLDGKAANDKRLALRVATELGVALAGTRVVSSVAELDATVPATEWVAKAPWSTAGRDRLLGRGPLAADQRTRASRLLETFGALIVEPWCDRIMDVGVCGTVDGSVHVEAPHGLVTDRFGTFSAIELTPPELTDAELSSLARAAVAAGQAIAALGHRGAFAIDAFVYRDGDARRLHPLCEINARQTFGTVARAFGRCGARALYLASPPPEARPLIAPADGVGAWIA
ncbi:MAG TPA: hypothetical protein VGM90_33945 [Kofleriaceae bacterium]